VKDLLDLTRRPVWLAPNPVHRFYAGGALWRVFRGEPDARNDRWAEDWVASCIGASDSAPDGSPQGKSRLAHEPDVLLGSLIAAEPVAMLGAAAARRWGSDPMIQVKLVSPRDRVPLHIHPDAAFAAEHLRARHGKAEAWIVLDAPGTPDGPTSCGIGMRDDVSPEVFCDAVMRQDRAALLDGVHRAPIAAGDVVYIAPGVPHFISGGTFFVEVQEPEDLGFLLEWQGFVDDERSATAGLGMESALRSLDSRPRSRDDAIGSAFQTPAIVRSGDGVTERRLFGTDVDRYFEATRLDVATVDEPEAGRYHVVVITGGHGVIEGAFGRDEIRVGDTFVVPATLEHRYRAAAGATLRLLRCFGPTADEAS
jgi:mannose-6-phosphate isomerase